MNNRIKLLREAAGLSAEQLAKKCGTTQPTITRLENGTRQLTEYWMRKIAKALDVEPGDLLATATIADFQNDVEPYFPEAMQDLAGPLKARNLSYFRVKTGAVSLAGAPPNALRLVDCSEAAIEGRKTGDLLIVQVSAVGDRKRTFRVIRVFVAPTLLTTNKVGRNMSFTTDETAFHVEILGVVLPP
jgi:transcriptional regulator with XRE-family HTH domain